MEPPLPLWTHDHFDSMSLSEQDGFHSIDMIEAYTPFGEPRHSSMSTSQPMQRFIQEYDTGPYHPGHFQAKFEQNTHSQHLHHNQYPYPGTASFPWARGDSPGGTSASGASTQDTHNELSKHTLYEVLTDSSSPESHAISAYYQPDVILSSSHIMAGGAPIEPKTESHQQQVINMREIVYDHGASEIVGEEVDHGDLKQDLEYDAEPVYPKVDPNPDQYNTYEERARDPQSVEPIGGEGDNSDSDYEPVSPKNKKRKRSSASSNGGSARQSPKRQKRGSKSTGAATVSSGNGVRKTSRASKATNGSAKGTSRATSGDSDERPFPCPLAVYGCLSNFSSKNEWKRHVSTQHIKQGFWRCDLCKPTHDSSDERTFDYNDFNRKDLFSQHLRRMHGSPPLQGKSSNQKGDVLRVNDDNLKEHHQRCYQKLREPPQHASCLFCDRRFEGVNAWDERMEHVGRHLEKEGKNGTLSLDPKQWLFDQGLEDYLYDEGLITRDKTANWTIGSGKPRRDSIISSAGESDVEP